MIRIHGEPGWAQGIYEVYAASATVEKEWRGTVRRRPEDAKRCFERLTSAPLQAFGARQFPLKGKVNKPFWEYEVSAGERLYYAVDPQRRVVIVSSGPHGKEDKSSAVSELVKRRRKQFDHRTNKSSQKKRT